MTRIYVQGYGVVSPAGWGIVPLRQALARGEPIPAREVTRPGWTHTLKARAVPIAAPRPAFTSHARLRRTSPIAQYTVAAALEALGPDVAPEHLARRRLGVIFCSMTGCVNYSQRFYDETLKNPATASPLVFPETVFNAPASHLSALLGSKAINYTLVGDPGTFLQGIALAADWLVNNQLDGCLVVGAEEFDWLISEAFRLFDRRGVVADGAGALYLRRETDRHPAIELHAITGSHLFLERASRPVAAIAARAELGPAKPDSILCTGTQGVPHLDQDENAAWNDWTGPRISPKTVLGEGFMAAAAWQCIAAVDELAQNGCAAADVSIVGCNQQAIAARFVKSNSCLHE